MEGGVAVHIVVYALAACLGRIGWGQVSDLYPGLSRPGWLSVVARCIQRVSPVCPCARALIFPACRLDVRWLNDALGRAG